MKSWSESGIELIIPSKPRSKESTLVGTVGSEAVDIIGTKHRHAQLFVLAFGIASSVAV